MFVHGKAGVIEGADGSKTCFLGSINETKSAFAENYEILWEDTSPEGVKWVEEEFEALWKDSFPLPDAIIEEIKRVADRVEVAFREVNQAELPAAALAESPIYRGGEQLQPWQRSFVTIFLKHRETYGRARLLLADEVGVGKTLSLAASAMLAALLDDGPVLILCPSTLTFQWQVELKDKLGVPSAVWISNKKVWQDHNEHIIKTRGPEDIVRCPFRIAIVSTGLIFHDSEERQHLLDRKYGTVVLDEAHKARRRGGLGERKDEPNNLLDFMLRMGPRTKHILLGTATPIQTQVSEVWDLMSILNSGTDFVCVALKRRYSLMDWSPASGCSEDRLRQHRVHTFYTIHYLRDVQIRRSAGEHVGIVARQATRRYQIVDHLPGGAARRLVQAFMKSHRDEVCGVSARGQRSFISFRTVKRNTPVKFVSIAVRQTSPSPSAACPSPTANRAPGACTGMYSLAPATSHLLSRLPAL